MIYICNSQENFTLLFLFVPSGGHWVAHGMRIDARTKDAEQNLGGQLLLKKLHWVNSYRKRTTHRYKESVNLKFWMLADIFTSDSNPWVLKPQLHRGWKMSYSDISHRFSLRIETIHSLIIFVCDQSLRICTSNLRLHGWYFERVPWCEMSISGTQ